MSELEMLKDMLQRAIAAKGSWLTNSETEALKWVIAEIEKVAQSANKSVDTSTSEGRLSA